MILFIIAVRVNCLRQRSKILHTSIVIVKELKHHFLLTELKNSASLAVIKMFQEDFRSGEYVGSCELAVLSGIFSKNIFYRNFICFLGKIAV
jgi:hypothetical protein